MVGYAAVTRTITVQVRASEPMSQLAGVRAMRSPFYRSPVGMCGDGGRRTAGELGQLWGCVGSTR
jgi:hypothetical protein